MIIYLTGYRGTGKTTIAGRVADAMSYTMVDLDRRIEGETGRTIADIFDVDGEAAFRDLETEALRSAAAMRDVVVSLGGGAVIRSVNREVIRSGDACFWLLASPKTILCRIAADETSRSARPALTELEPTAEIESVLRKRRNWYADVATQRVDTEGRSAADIAREITLACGGSVRGE